MERKVWPGVIFSLRRERRDRYSSRRARGNSSSSRGFTLEAVARVAANVRVSSATWRPYARKPRRISHASNEAAGIS
jgi:hypothetical protein